MDKIYKYAIKIPYGSREKYLPAVKEINRLVPLNGLVSLFVNNNPYHFEAYVVVESSAEFNEIENIVRENNLEIDRSKGLTEFLNGMIKNRRWNQQTMIKDMDESVDLAFKNCFIFRSESELQNRGYVVNKEFTRKKIFISYCHSNKRVVEKITDELQRRGLYLWLDKQEIDNGESIISKVHSGIAECDLAVIFISKATIDAQFAKHEFTSIWSDIVYGKRNWFLIKVDNVNPDDIFQGLSDIKYYDYGKRRNVSEIIDEIENKLKKIDESRF